MKDDDDDGDDDEAPDRLERAQAALDEGLAGLREDLARLQDRNTLYPFTKAFLERCGVSHVKELTPEQTIEYKAYLQAEHDALFGSKKPSN